MRRAIIVVLALALLLPAGVLAQGPPPTRWTCPGWRARPRSTGTPTGSPTSGPGAATTCSSSGWVHAQDRLFQMDVRRRQAGGTLAELLGPAALGTDVQLRAIGLHRAAARSLPALSDDARAVLAAYADGVNAWVAGNPLPPEYGALSLTSFRPWTALDSVAVGKLQAFGLSFDLDIELTTALLGYQQAGQAAGFDGTALFFQDLWRAEPFTDASTVPDASQAGAAAATASGRRPGAPRWTPPGRPASGCGPRAGWPSATPPSRPRCRCCARPWPATGARPAPTSGRCRAGWPPAATRCWPTTPTWPWTPSTFYPVHLQAGQTDAIGSGFAGTPGVIVGNNRFISWGATVNPMDVTDTYAEQVVPDPASPSGLSTVYKGQKEPVIPIPETFRQNNPARAPPTTSPSSRRADPAGDPDRAPAQQRPHHPARPGRRDRPQRPVHRLQRHPGAGHLPDLGRRPQP